MSARSDSVARDLLISFFNVFRMDPFLRLIMAPPACVCHHCVAKVLLLLVFHQVNLRGGRQQALWP